MACPFDVRSLDGRTFGSVADEIAPGWEAWGFSEWPVIPPQGLSTCTARFCLTQLRVALPLN